MKITVECNYTGVATKQQLEAMFVSFLQQAFMYQLPHGMVNVTKIEITENTS